MFKSMRPSNPAVISDLSPRFIPFWLIVLSLAGMMPASVPAWGAPFTREQVIEGVELGATAFSHDGLMATLESREFTYVNGLFQPRDGLLKENLAQYQLLGKEAYFHRVGPNSKRYSKSIIQKTFLGDKKVPVLFVYILGVELNPQNVLPKELAQGLAVKYGMQAIRVYLGHDEFRLTKAPISNSAVADSKAIAELQFTLANTLDKNVHIGWLGSSRREAGIATELTRRLLELFQNPLSGTCTVSMAATHPASVKIGIKFGFLEMTSTEAKEFWVSRNLPQDTDHKLELTRGVTGE